MVGHAVEVQESIDVLQDRGPKDLREVVLALGAELLMSVGNAENYASALRIQEQHLRDGSAWHTFQQMVQSQSGRLEEGLKIAPAREIVASTPGTVSAIDALSVAHALAALGGARQRMEDTLDLSVGVEVLVRVGDTVDAGQPVARIFAHNRGVEEAMSLVTKAIRIGDEHVAPAELILERWASESSGRTSNGCPGNVVVQG
jgi:thymidine phosphorylase